MGSYFLAFRDGRHGLIYKNIYIFLIRLAVFFLPQATGIGRNQEVNSKTMKARKNLLLSKTLFCYGPKYCSFLIFLQIY
jgi:hypothetical protein